MGDKEKDRELAMRAMAGDEDAFAGLVERHHASLFRLALRLTGSRQDAEDLTQETFLRVHAKFGSYDPGKPFDKWLFAVGLNAARDHLRRRGPAAPLAQEQDGLGTEPAPGQAAGPEEPEPALARAQDRNRIADVLLQLSIEHREAVVMRYYMDLSFAEIARAADVSLSSAKMRVYRGLERLRELMGNENNT